VHTIKLFERPISRRRQAASNSASDPYPRSAIENRSVSASWLAPTILFVSF